MAESKDGESKSKKQKVVKVVSRRPTNSYCMVLIANQWQLIKLYDSPRESHYRYYIGADYQGEQTVFIPAKHRDTYGRNASALGEDHVLNPVRWVCMKKGR